jgi:AmpD protein
MLSKSSKKVKNKPEKLTFQIEQGWLKQAEHLHSPHYSKRTDNDEISLLVVHNISLPAGQFGNSYISDLFLGKLDISKHKSFSDLDGVRVSAHCLIKRDGHIIQYVSFNDKAWHAGVSSFKNKDQCNDFSIGIELEGTDEVAYTKEQYQQLVILTHCLQEHFPAIMGNVVGHCDIAPNRKTDPGQSFDWHYFRQRLDKK